MTRETSRTGMRFRWPCSKSGKATGGSLLGEGVEGGAEAFEAGAKGTRVAADANAKVARHFEETAGDDGGFVFFAEQFEKGFRITAMREARENHRAGRRAKTFEVAAGVEERIEQGAIGGEQRSGAFAELFEMVQGHHGEALGGVRGRS